MQNEYITEQMTQLQSTMNEYVHVMQVNQTKTREEIQSLTAEVSRLESVTEQKQAEIERLNVTLWSHQNRETLLRMQVSYVTAERDEIRGGYEISIAEIERLRATARRLNENAAEHRAAEVGLGWWGGCVAHVLGVGFHVCFCAAIDFLFS